MYLPKVTVKQSIALAVLALAEAVERDKQAGEDFREWAAAKNVLTAILRGKHPKQRKNGVSTS